jgi:molybdopterin converting factor small subunit
MATLRIPTPLRAYVDGQSEVPVQGETVGAALDDLIGRYPTLKPHLMNGDGQLRPFVNLFLGENNVRELEGTQTPIKEDDRLMLIPSIAGGI